MVWLQKRFKVLAIITIIASVFVFIINSEQITAASHKRKIITPNQARNFLNDLDMPTRPYSNIGAPNSYGKYEADSDNLILESKTGERNINNLSYSVFGDKFVAKAVELNLAVNDLSFSSNATENLIKYSDVLTYKVMGEKLTPEIKKAIHTKKQGQWIINGYKIKLTKEIFPDEEPIEGVESISDHGAFSLTFIIEL